MLPPIPVTWSIDALSVLLYRPNKRIKNMFRGKKSGGSLEDKLFQEQQKRVTVVISSHRIEGTMEDIIRDVYKQTLPPFNVYISDSNLGNIKEIVERLKEEFPNLHYWSKEGVTAKADKINHLVRDPIVELGDYVYFKDSTAKTDSDMIEKMVSAFSDKKMAATTSYGFVTPPDNFLSGFFHFGKEWANRIGQFRKSGQANRRAVYVMCGASFMIRSDILREYKIPIGTQTEDLAYTWLLQEEGYKVGVVQDAAVWTEDVSPLKAQLSQTYRWYTGYWQNLYLHSKKIFSPKSKAKSLGYSTILPGLGETLMYSCGIAALPAIIYFAPDYAKYFFYADTLLTFVAPIVSLPFIGKIKDVPKEILHTIQHFPQIESYKVLSSALFLHSFAKVTYEAITGKAKNWDNTWKA